MKITRSLLYCLLAVEPAKSEIKNQIIRMAIKLNSLILKYEGLLSRVKNSAQLSSESVDELSANIEKTYHLTESQKVKLIWRCR